MAKIKLGDICNFQSGGTPAKGIAEFFNGTIPWITTTALNGGKIDGTQAVDWITEKAIEKSAAKLVPAYSIMVGTRVGIGKVAVNTVEMSTSQDIISLLDIDENHWNKDYICKFVQGNSRFLNSKARGATIKGIKIDVLASLELKEISLEEQVKISEIIDKVKNIINARKQEIANLDSLIQSRFVEIFGDLANPESPWDKSKLIDVCTDKDDIKCGPFGTQLSKDEYTESGVAVWEIPQINSAFLTRPTHFLSKEKAEQLKAYTIVPGDIAMSRKGNVGKCAVFPENYPEGIIHSDVLRIRVDSKIINPRFLMSQLHFSGAVTRQIEMVSSGAIMAGVNVTKLKHIYIYVPPMNFQNQFVDFVAGIDKSKAAIQHSLDETQVLFDSLMQKYFG